MGSSGGLATIHPFAIFGHSESPRFLLLPNPRLAMASRRVNLLSSSTIASASASGAGAGYSEQLLGAKPKERKKKIAGIDQDELLDPELLADPDSCFCEFKGLQIHHKLCDDDSATEAFTQDQTTSDIASQTRKLGLPIVLLHGFGASLFSWHRVMKPLARVTGSKVLAFDRPAFGLTSRRSTTTSSDDARPLNPYSMIFSVLATLYFIDVLATEKAILVGHSAGSLVAVDTYFEAPEKVAALILVAPAIFAPLAGPKPKDQLGRDAQEQEESSNSNVNKNPLIKLSTLLANVTKYIVHAILSLARGMGEMLSSLYKKALSSILRSALGVAVLRTVIDKFGVAAVRNAWYDPNQVSEHIINGYTKPLRTKGWDRALVEFTAAMLTDPLAGKKPPLADRLSEISCPVLVVTGDRDRLVPSWNAERLSRAIPGASLEVIKNCGHLPQEEKPEEFVAIVEKFLLRALSGSQEQQSLQQPVAT